MQINLSQLIQITSLFTRFSIRRSLQIAAASAAIAYGRDALHGATPLHVEVSGAGEPLLFVPGLACSGDVWDEAVAEFEKGYECHVFTLPGFAGQVPAEYEGKYVDFIARELDRYIDEHHMEKPVMVGHSLGGFVGLLMASEPDCRLSGLMVVDSLPFLSATMNPAATEESVKGMAQAMANQAKAMQPEQIRQMLSGMITAPDRVNQALEWSSQSDPATVSQAMMDLYTTDLRDEVGNIRIPVHVLGSWVAYKAYGATRESTMAIYDTQYMLLPHYQLEMTDIGRHFIMWDDPEFFMNSTKSFLSQIRQ